MDPPHVVSTVLLSATSTTATSVSAPVSSIFCTGVLDATGVLLAARRAAAAPLMPRRSV